MEGACLAGAVIIKLYRLHSNPNVDLLNSMPSDSKKLNLAQSFIAQYSAAEMHTKQCVYCELMYNK